MRRIIFAQGALTLGALLFSVQQAVALSCIPPNLAQTFNQLNEVPEPYALMIGNFEPTGPVPQAQPGVPMAVSYNFQGNQVGSGFVGPHHHWPVIVESKCLASWCGGLPQPRDTMMVFFGGTERTVCLCAGSMRFDV